MSRAACVLVAAACAVGCRHGGLDRSVSHGMPTTARVEDVPVKGFDVEIKTTSFHEVDAEGGELTEHDTVSGELLAVGPEGIYVLADQTTRLVPADKVKSVSVELYDSGSFWMVSWTVVGALSTASHGFFLILTAPTWLVGGGVTAGVAGAMNDVNVKPGSVVFLYQFARFPAGLPAAWSAVRGRAPLAPDAWTPFPLP